MKGLAVATAEHFVLPLSAVTETFGILAVKRAGKSNAAVVIAEEMFDAGLPWVAVDPKGDWWGVRSSGDGKNEGLRVIVFGGLHGDVPLEPGAGKLVADMIAERRLTAVLDVSEMTKQDQRRFLTDFAAGLYRKNREPLHVFCEEADEYIPQTVRGENAKLVGAFETLVKRGGFRGIGITLITQRSASLNKDVLSQVGTLIAMRTPGAHDRKAILAWVDFHGAAAKMVPELPTLSAGEAFVFSPEWLPKEGLPDLTRIRFRRRRTFDSGATPEIGKVRATPARLAEVDLDVIRDQMKEAIDRAEAEDPKILQRRIRDLERQVAAEKKTAAAHEEALALALTTIQDPPAPVEVPILSAETLDHLQDLLDPAADVLRQIAGILGAQIEHVAPARPAKEEGLLGRPVKNLRPAPYESTVADRVHRTVVPADRAPARVDGTLGKRERLILGALAQYPDGRTQRQLALLCGYSAKASTIGAGLSALRARGLVVASGLPKLTPAGEVAAADLGVEALPTGDALLDYWRGEFGPSSRERKILDLLLDAGGAPGLSNDEIAEKVGFNQGTSTVGAGLSKLRTLGLVAKGSPAHLSDEFLEAIR